MFLTTIVTVLTLLILIGLIYYVGTQIIVPIYMGKAWFPLFCKKKDSATIALEKTTNKRAEAETLAQVQKTMENVTEITKSVFEEVLNEELPMIKKPRKSRAKKSPKNVKQKKSTKGA